MISVVYFRCICGCKLVRVWASKLVYLLLNNDKFLHSVQILIIYVCVQHMFYGIIRFMDEVKWFSGSHIGSWQFYIHLSMIAKMYTLMTKLLLLKFSSVYMGRIECCGTLKIEWNFHFFCTVVRPVCTTWIIAIINR